MTHYFYSPSLHTFMVEGLHTDRPSDCVQITGQEYASLLQQQSLGFVIMFDSMVMKPVACPVPERTEFERMELLQQDKSAELNRAAEKAITGGFNSDALGSTHQYSSQLDDQLNLTGAILRGLDMPYACRDEQGVKAFRLHTAEQLRQVGDDFTLYKLQLLQHANELKQQLDLALAAGDAEAMALIRWEAVQP